VKGEVIHADSTFSCADLSDRNPKIVFDGAAWPQVFYIHYELSPWLRKHFGFHAAYFLGNYLFGSQDSPECRIESSISTVEGFHFAFPEAITPDHFAQLINRCGIDPKSSLLVVNGTDNVSSFSDVVRFDKEVDFVCVLRKLISGTRIVHTFGSRLGFWAAALQGNAGGIMNSIDHICVNLTNSQQGSLWHTYCPMAMRSEVFTANRVLFSCHSQMDNFLLYFQYLLW
jgi:hypothetical protein